MTIDIKNATPDQADILIYGEIGGGWFSDPDNTVTAKNFAADLKALGKVKNLNIYINSPGGAVFEGQAIYSQLKRHAAHKTVHIDGLAASIASVIAMAGDTIIMPDNALMMIHRASGLCMGDASDLRKTADALEKAEAGIVAAYAQKTEKSTDELLALMAEETWMTAAEALEMGFADQTDAATPMTACASPAALARFKHPPETLLNMTASAPPTPSLENPMSETVPETPATPAIPDPVPEPVAAPESPVISDAPPAAPVVVADAEHAAFIAAQCHQARCSVLAAGLIAAQATKAQVEARIAEATQIKAACVLAKLPEQTDHYLASGMDITAVRADLFLQLAARDQQTPVNTALSTEATQATASLPLEDRCKAEWQASPALRAEFADSLESFIAYSRAAHNGQVRVFTK